MTDAASPLELSWNQSDIATWLDALLSDLDRSGGLKVGPRERLDAIAAAAIFRTGASATFAEAERERLGRIMAAVLAKSEHERSTVRDACRRTFVDRVDGTWQKPGWAEFQPAPPSITPASKQQRKRSHWSIAATGLVLAAALTVWLLQAPAPVVVRPAPDRDGRATPIERSGGETGAPAPAAKADEPLTETEITAAAGAITSAAGGARHVTLWELARGLARLGDPGRDHMATYKLLQLHSALTSTAGVDLQDATVRERLLWAWLYIDKPSRNAPAELVRRVSTSTEARVMPASGSRLTAMPPAMGAYIMPWWLAGLIVATPLTALGLWLRQSGDRKRRYAESVLSRGQGRSGVDVPARGIDTAPLAQQQRQLRAAAHHLAVPQEIETRALDVESTIDASLARGGIFTPRFAHRRFTPEYVAVILSHGPDDQEADRLSYVVEQLTARSGTEAGADARSLATIPEVLHRQDTPIRRVYMEHVTGNVFVGHTEPRITLADLAGRTPAHRLILLGTGDGLLDPVTLQPQPWAETVRLWPVRALATPVPQAEWSEREARLSGLMDGPLFETTARGLDEMARHLRDRAGDDDGTSKDYQHKVRRLWRFDPDHFMMELPYDEEAEWAELSPELDRYLATGDGGSRDERGRAWLRALAVYPALRWDLTSYIGLKLTTPDANGARRPLYDDEIATRLSALPWFEAGRMPRWVRKRLIAELSPERRGDVLRAIGELLVGGGTAETGTTRVRLPVAASGSAVGVAGLEGASEATQRTPQDDLAANDRELLELLDAAPVGLLEGKRRTWRDWLSSLGGQFAPGDARTATVFATYSLAALWLVPKPWGGAAPAGGWWGISLLGLALLTLPLAAWFMRRATATVEAANGETG